MLDIVRRGVWAFQVGDFAAPPSDFRYTNAAITRARTAGSWMEISVLSAAEACPFHAASTHRGWTQVNKTPVEASPEGVTSPGSVKAEISTSASEKRA